MKETEILRRIGESFDKHLGPTFPSGGREKYAAECTYLAGELVLRHGLRRTREMIEETTRSIK